MALIPEDEKIRKLEDRIEQLEKNGIQKQVSGLSIKKGQNTTDTDIIGAKEVILHYTVSAQKYFGSVAVSCLMQNWYKVFSENNKAGYFMVYFNTGIIQSSSGTDEMIELVGYDIIK